MGYELVGKVWDANSFAEYVRGLDLSWAKGITMHHTAAPSLAQRPAGLKIQHIRNMESFYRSLGWSRGPHLFVDEDQIFGMSSLEERGIHAVSFNRTHIGIEVLGDYDTESPTEGRGKKCWEMAWNAVAALLRCMPGVTEENVNGHRDDPKTTKTCPGRLVDLNAFRESLRGYGVADDRQDDDAEIITMRRRELNEILQNIEWQMNKLRDK